MLTTSSPGELTRLSVLPGARCAGASDDDTEPSLTLCH